jgi:hypothetical protein
MSGSPVDRDYVSWLEEESMLARGARVRLVMGDALTRWINRPAYDLMSRAPEVDSASAMPRGRSRCLGPHQGRSLLLSGGHVDLAAPAAGGSPPVRR